MAGGRGWVRSQGMGDRAGHVMGPDWRRGVSRAFLTLAKPQFPQL